VIVLGASCRAWLSSSDEALVEFTRRAGDPKTLEERNIFDMMIRRSFGEITLTLTDEQYAKLKGKRARLG
jgi:hypothetical protein